MIGFLQRSFRFLRRTLWVIIPYCVVLAIGIYVFTWYEGIYFPYSYHRMNTQAHDELIVLQETNNQQDSDRRAIVLGYTNNLSSDADIQSYVMRGNGTLDTGKFAIRLPQTTIIKALRLSDTQCMMIVVHSNTIHLRVYSETLSILSDYILEQANRSYGDVKMFMFSPDKIFVQLGQQLYFLQQRNNVWLPKEIAKDVVAIPVQADDKPLQQLPFIRKSEYDYFLSMFDPETNFITPPIKIDADATPTIVPLHNMQFGIVAPTNLRTRALLFRKNVLTDDIPLPEAPITTVWWGSTPNSTMLHRIVVTSDSMRLISKIMSDKQGISQEFFSLKLRPWLSYPLGFVVSPHGAIVRFINGWVEINQEGRVINSADMVTTRASEDALLSLFDRTGRMATREFYCDTEMRDGNKYAVLYRRMHHPWYWIKNIISNTGDIILVSCLFGVFILIVQKLRQYRRISYAIIKTPSAPITLVIDTNRRITFESAKARELLVKNETIALQGRKISSLKLDNTGKKVSAMIEQCFRENQNITDDIEHIEIRKQEEILRVYDCTVSPITSFGNHLRGVLLIGRDVTEEREKKEVEISWSIAHDMQTPLATINMAIGRLQNMIASDTLNTKQLRDAIKTVAVQSRNLSERVNDWRILAGKQIDKPIETDMRTLCESLVDEIGPGFYDGAVHFVADVTPRLVVLCYDKNIKSALRNVIINSLRAIDHNQESHNAQHAIYIKIYKEQVYPYCLVIEVGDTGVGIKKEVLQKLNRGAIVTEHQRKGGTGTGTRIVRDCIRKHNARDAKKMRLPALEYESPAIMQHLQIREDVVKNVEVKTKVTLRLLPIYKRKNDIQNQQMSNDYVPIDSQEKE
jgi:signal transduction histidine kinase